MISVCDTDDIAVFTRPGSWCSYNGAHVLAGPSIVTHSQTGTCLESVAGLCPIETACTGTTEKTA